MLSNLLSLYFFPLLLACLFFGAGCALAFRPKWLERRLPDAKMRTGGIPRGVGVFLVAVSSAGLVFLLAGPSPWQRARLISCVLEATPAEIASAKIAPGPLPFRNSPNLVAAARTIDRRSLQQICDALRRAEVSSGKTNNDVVWECELQLHRKTGTTCRCFVCRSISKGVLIRVESKASFGMGWSVGTFRDDSLGPILESIAWSGPSHKDARPRGIR